MAKISTGFKQRELIPEGSYTFMIVTEPKERIVPAKGEKREYTMVDWKFQDANKNQQFEKSFFPNQIMDILTVLGVTVDDKGLFESADTVGKSFKCDVVHIFTSSGKEVDNLVNLQSFDGAWDS